MKALLYIVAAAALLAGSDAAAQVTYPPAIPGDTIPPSETTSGQIGGQANYARSDHIHPRITRATTCVLDATGSCTITWATPLPSAPTIGTTPINPTAAQAIMCNTTATPTATSVSIKCWTIQTTLLSLAIITAGLNLVPATTAPAGTNIQVIALQPSQ